MDPYLRPVYDALSDFGQGSDNAPHGAEKSLRLLPSLYAGADLDDAFVILDGAQNTTIMQMKRRTKTT